MVSYHGRIELFQNHPSKRNPSKVSVANCAAGTVSGKREGVWHVEQ